MSLFEQIAGAKTQTRGRKVDEDGSFVVALDAVKIQQSNRGMKTVFVVEFDIVEGTEKNPAGAKRSWVQFPEHREQTDPGNIRLFVGALLGIPGDEPEVSAEQWDGVLSGKYQGKLLDLDTEMVTTKSGHPFCVHTWSHHASAADAGAGAPPPPPAALTKEAWLAGDGLGVEHPQAPDYEYHPQHTEWGVRKK